MHKDLGVCVNTIMCFYVQMGTSQSWCVEIASLSAAFVSASACLSVCYVWQ